MAESVVPVLTLIQNELKAPKSQYNSFGKYKYRNVEDIFEGLKPLLVKHQAEVEIEETYAEVAGMVVLTETVVYTDKQHPKGEELRIEGHAPIGQHKGMSPEQSWGTAASYAKKYALGNLFLIDDSQDVDSMDNRQSPQQPRQQYHRQTPNQAQLHANATNSFAEARSLKKRGQEEKIGNKTFFQVYQEYLKEGKGGPASQALESWVNEDKTGSRLAFTEEFGKHRAWE